MTRTRTGLALGLLLALAVAACGGGGGKSSGVASLGDANQATATTSAGSSQNEQQAALAFARCMRQHGVNMPDPQITANGMRLRPPPKSPKVETAVQACRQYLPNGGEPPALTAQERQRALAFARCVRQHGISAMPDPQFTGNRTVQDPPPGMERDDPRLRAAVRACEQFLPAHKRGRGGG